MKTLSITAAGNLCLEEEIKPGDVLELYNENNTLEKVLIVEGKHGAGTEDDEYNPKGY